MPRKKSALESFIEAIAGFSGLPMCVYDLDYFTRDDQKLNVSTPLREHCSAFCKKIKSDPDGFARCVKDEYFRAEKANARNGPFIHTCHAGLTDLVVPIRRGEKQIGALYLGQAITLPAPEQKAHAARLAKRFGFPRAEIAKLQAGQPHRTVRQLERHVALLNGLRDYIELSEQVLERNPISSQRLIPPIGTAIAMEKIPIFFLDQLRPQSEAIQKAVQRVRAAYWKRIGLPEVAEAAGLSQSHFSREFRREVGMTFRKCLVETRMNAVLYLLKRSHLNVGQIAERVGYENFSSMGRAFRKHVGATPKQFIRIQAPPWMVDDLKQMPLVGSDRKK